MLKGANLKGDGGAPPIDQPPLISSKGILNDLRSNITYDIPFLLCLIKCIFIKTLTHWVVL